ncbi:UNVERIFIED_CONTAM: hypothetical protein K2H54_064620, partial [Gekko kuhli]
MSSHIKLLSHDQAAILLSIDSPKKRYSLFCDEQHFTSICFLKIHDVVQLRCGRVLTVGIVRGFWKQLRNPGHGELKMVLIEVELLIENILGKDAKVYSVSPRPWIAFSILLRYGYVGAENMMALRKLLGSDSFITEEKDPEEFLNVLLGEVLAIKPLLKIKAGNEVLKYNCYQILVERDSLARMPTVQQLLEESLLSYDLKFAEALPHEPRQKHPCTEQKHNSCSTKSQTLELFAVLCIERNHYVAFVRCGAPRQSWLFFDSMAGQL